MIRLKENRETINLEMVFKRIWVAEVGEVEPQETSQRFLQES